MAKRKKKMGRPKKSINKKQFEAFMRVKPTIIDAANFFNCSHDTIERFSKDKFGVTFALLREQKAVASRFSLQRKAMQMAEKGDRVMLIFCLKNLCHWKDKIEDEEDRDPKPIQLNYKL